MCRLIIYIFALTLFSFEVFAQGLTGTETLNVQVQPFGPFISTSTQAIANLGKGGGGTPGGTSGQFQYNNSGIFGGLTNANALTQIAGGILIDPRNSVYGSNTCTGYYGIATSSLGSGGAGYSVNDTFNVNSSWSYATPGMSARGHVTSVSGGVVTGYNIDYVGAAMTIASGVNASTTSGSGSGLTINILTVGTGNDDTTAFTNAGLAALATRGSVLIPDNCWVQALQPQTGTNWVGQSYAVNYSYSYEPTAQLNIIGQPSYGIYINGVNTVGFANFQLASFQGGSTSCWGGTGGGGPKIWFYQVSAKGCNNGLYSQGEMFIVAINSDWGGNTNGIVGNFSDYYIQGNTFVSENVGINIQNGGSGGGFGRIMDNRFEFLNQNAIILNGTHGSVLTSMTGNQFDHILWCAVQLNGDSTLDNITGGSIRAVGLSGSLVITGAANNGSGLIRLTVSGGATDFYLGTATSGLSTGDTILVAGVTGTTEANGTWTLTKIDGTHIDLQSSTFTNAYVSGGRGSVKQKDAAICLNGNTVNGFTMSNVNISTEYAEYGNANSLGPAYVFDGATSTNNNIQVIGGEQQALTGSNLYTAGYTTGYANWWVSAPAAFTVLGVDGTPDFKSNNTTWSFNSVGTMGLGTSTPNTNAILDMSQAAAAQSSFLFPSNTSGNRPTGVAGAARFNTTSNTFEGFNGTQWGPIGATVLPNYLGGLTLSNDSGTPNTILDIAVGTAASDDNTEMMNLAVAITKTTGSFTAGTGNGCLDTGSVANSTWYTIYEIENITTATVDVLCSTSSTNPTMPSGFTVKRRIGSIETDASARILAFKQVGSLFYWGTATLDINTSSLSTSAVLQTLNVPPGVKVTPLCRYSVSNTGNSVILTSGDETDVAPGNALPISSAPGQDMTDESLTSGVANLGCPFLTTNTSSQIRARASASSTTLSIVTRGWID